MLISQEQFTKKIEKNLESRLNWFIHIYTYILQKWFDYEIDSDDEWEEEEPGESLKGSDDEKDEENPEENEYDVDNEFMVPHG